MLALAVLCALAALGTPAPEAQAKDALTVMAIDIAADGTASTLRIKMTKSVKAEVSSLGQPYRIVVDLPKAEFRVPGEPAAVQPITGYRYGNLDAARSRIVLDADRPLLIRAARFEKSQDGLGQVLVIELEPTDAAGFGARPPAAGGSEPVASTGLGALVPKPKAADASKLTPVVVIDAGHGGLDSGAISPKGVREKDVVLAFARKLRDLLKESGRYKVLMTRDADTFISLGGRVAFARKHGASLFISIHADTVDDGRYYSAKGAAVYTRSSNPSDEAARRTALKENMSDIMAGVEVPEEQDAVTDILMDLVQRETRTHSTAFARTMVGQLKRATHMLPTPQREAEFYVLKAPEVPSVLVELGFVSNKEEEQTLVSETWRSKVAASMVTAVDEFFEARGSGLPF